MLLIQGGAIESLAPREREALLERAQALAPDEVPSLADGIDHYLLRIHEALSRNEFLNVDLAQRVGTTLKALLAMYSDLASNQTRALVIGATRFFLETNDVLADLDSPLGFDDDARVLNAVLRDIGREHLLVSL